MFSVEDELEKLKQEFGHQQLKLDEYDALKDEMKSMEGQLQTLYRLEREREFEI